MKRFFLTIILLFIHSIAVAADPDILIKFFGHSGIIDKRSIYHGEMLQYYVNKPTLGEGLPKNVLANFRPLEETKSKAVYAVLLSDGRKTQDWYAYLVKENDIWKICAIRNLALSGVFYSALKELETKNQRTVEEEWQYQNMLLTIKSDSELKTYLINNFNDFKNVFSLYSNGEIKQSEIEAKRLFINHVGYNGAVFELNIGGILDNSVGYLYVPPGTNQPKMSTSDFIYVEEVADRWYIYKTT